MRCVSGLGAACGFFPGFAKALRVPTRPYRAASHLHRPSGGHARVDTRKRVQNSIFVVIRANNFRRVRITVIAVGGATTLLG